MTEYRSDVSQILSKVSESEQTRASKESPNNDGDLYSAEGNFYRQEKINQDELVKEIKNSLILKLYRQVMLFLWIYLMFVVGAIMLSGFNIYKFSLPDNVLAVVAGSIAVSVIGLFGILVKGVFWADKR